MTLLDAILIVALVVCVYALVLNRSEKYPHKISNAFIIYQNIVTSEQRWEDRTDISIDSIVRVVYAKNKEEAIGKFITTTNKIQVVKKLEPTCIELTEISFVN